MQKGAETLSARVGVLSDTHGLVRPEIRAALAGVDCILHAGDIGAPEVIDELERMAPLHIIRGNIDSAAWAARIPETKTVEIAGKRIYLIHNLATLELDPKLAGIDIVVSGHSHRPLAENRDGIYWLNPGSAGPRRFTLPICLSILQLGGPKPRSELVHLLTE